jgi:hypothetical protein
MYECSCAVSCSSSRRFSASAWHTSGQVKKVRTEGG